MVPKTKRMLFGERHCSLSFALSFVWCDETHFHEKKSILFNMVCNLASQQHHYITVSRKYFTCTYTHTLSRFYHRKCPRVVLTKTTTIITASQSEWCEMVAECRVEQHRGKLKALAFLAFSALTLRKECAGNDMTIAPIYEHCKWEKCAALKQQQAKI